MPNFNLIAITSSSECQESARLLAQELLLPYIPEPSLNHAYKYLLWVTIEGIGIGKTGGKNLFRIDFSTRQMDYRRKAANRRNELIAKAMGVTPKVQPVIVDATAGLGRDSFVLATLGYKVTMLEKSPILYAMLADALMRAKLDPELANICSRLRLIKADALTWLASPRHVDIIYLDPMFPARKKTAAVKKAMAIVQELVQSSLDPAHTARDDGDEEEALLTVALSCASMRVVVKRPRLAGFLANHRPSFSLQGRSSRFDVYLV